MASHRADGSAFRRPPAPAHGRRRLQPPPPPVGGRHRAAHRAPAKPVWASQLPQAGVVGVLGLATIVAPLAGDVLPSGGHAAQARSTATAAGAAAVQAVNEFRVLPQEPLRVPESLAQDGAVAPTAAELAAVREAADRASRELQRKALEQQALQDAVPGCDGVPVQLDAANGRLSTDDLCELWGTGHYLRSDAAVALAKLSFAYRDRFGTDLSITDSYRSYRSQVSLRARKPGLAARPGTSEHGWGLAVDLGGGVEAADEHYAWLRENAPTYGWDNPDWARSGGSGAYEPWHWEYVAGEQ